MLIQSRSDRRKRKARHITYKVYPPDDVPLEAQPAEGTKCHLMNLMLTMFRSSDPSFSHLTTQLSCQLMESCGAECQLMMMAKMIKMAMMNNDYDDYKDDE